MSTLILTWLVSLRSRGGWPRLIGMACGIAIGVALVLLVLGAYQGMTVRSERSTWTVVDQVASTPSTTDPAAARLDDRHALVTSTGSVGTLSDLFDGQTIIRVDIAATAKTTVTVPGVGAPPRPGEYVASPALAALIADHPADELGDRYGAPAGTIGAGGLGSPDALVVVVGVTPEEILSSPLRAYEVTSLAGFPYPSANYRTIAIIGGIAVVFPVLILIAIVTRLGQAVRSERFSALRLIGASGRRVAIISAIEIGASSVVGSLLGVVLYLLSVPLAARVSLEDGRFYAADILVAPPTVCAVVAATVVIATLAALVSTRSADLGPLGASRERRERPPRGLLLLPLALSFAVLVAFTVASISVPQFALPYSDLVFIGGFVVIAFGIVIAGPVLTSWAARLGARLAGGPAAVLATGRIREHPRAVFRSVSGLVVAVFIVSVFSAGITTVTHTDIVEASGDLRVPSDALLASSASPVSTGVASDEENAAEIATERDQLDELATAPGVRGTALVLWSDTEGGPLVDAEDAATLGISVPAGAGAVRLDPGYFSNTETDADTSAPEAATITPDAYASNIVVLTDGTATSIERARTALVTSGIPLDYAPQTRAEQASGSSLDWAARYAGFANIGIVIAALISAISLAVSTLAGVIERRRTLGLLRLSGMPAATLRRMLVIEAAVPVLAVTVLCVGLGFAVAWAIIAGLTQGRRTISWPDPSFFLTIAVCLAIAAAAVAATFRTAASRTAVTATRFE